MTIGLNVTTFRAKLLLFGGMMAIAIAVAWFRTREPVVDGRTISEWLEETDWRPGRKASPEATNAIRKIGPTALPFLLKELQAKDPKWKNALYASRFRDKFPNRWLNSESRQMNQALTGFSILGSNAAPAIPELSRMLDNVYFAERASEALVHIGSSAWPFLKSGLTNASPEIRSEILVGMELAKIKPQELWPELTRLSRDTNWQVAGRALTFIVAHLDDPGAIEAVRDALTNNHTPRTQVTALLPIRNAAVFLFNGASNAPLLEPDIVSLLTNSNTRAQVRHAATNALRFLNPVTAAAHGINTNAQY